MSNGKLQCMGSSLFLKNKFGVGYTLTIVKESQTKQANDVLANISKDIEDIVRSHVPDAEPLSNVGAEQSFRLPFSSSNKFEDMFRDIDSRKSSLGIAEYGISVTTLEEVFIRVDRHDYTPESAATEVSPSYLSSQMDSRDGSDSETSNAAPQLREKSRDIYMDSMTSPLHQVDIEQPVDKVLREGDDDSSFVTFVKHFKALFEKRLIYGKRDKRMMLCQCILPFIVVVLGLSLLLIRPNLSQPDLILSPVKLNANLDFSLRNFVPFYVEGDSPSTVGLQMQKQFTGEESSGVYGVAVPLGDSVQGTEDSFAGCSQGASPLYDMSEFLLQTQPGGKFNRFSYVNLN